MAPRFAAATLGRAARPRWGAALGSRDEPVGRLDRVCIEGGKQVGQKDGGREEHQP